MTNGDKIRQMSDEELSYFFNDVVCEAIDEYKNWEIVKIKILTKWLGWESIKEYLESEAKE